jgi:hypothetical protein
MNRSPTCILAPLLAAGIALSSAGQQSNTKPPVKGMASTVGLYVYPEKQQGATQQLTDESQCYGNAKTQSGFDPDATTTGTKHQAQKGGNDHGAAKGAATGAVIAGATGGDAGAGAARGAIVGGVRARRKEKKQEEQAQKQADAAKTQQQQNQDNFKRAMTACLIARGYSVK